MSKLEIFVLGLRISNFAILGFKISIFTKTQIFTKSPNFTKITKFYPKKFLISQILWVLGERIQMCSQIWKAFLQRRKVTEYLRQWRLDSDRATFHSHFSAREFGRSQDIFFKILAMRANFGDFGDFDIDFKIWKKRTQRHIGTNFGKFSSKFWITKFDKPPWRNFDFLSNFRVITLNFKFWILGLRIQILGFGQISSYHQICQFRQQNFLQICSKFIKKSNFCCPNSNFVY